MPELTAKDIMIKDVITINKNASIEELSELLLKNKISGVPVVDDDGNMVGIVTEGDIIVKGTELHFPRYFKLLDSIIYLESLNKFKNNLRKHLATKVEEIMNPKVITASPDTPVSEIAELMIRNKVNRIPIISKDKKLVGIITRADIVSSIVNKDKDKS
jgi:CBS domain-containing protein